MLNGLFAGLLTLLPAGLRAGAAAGSSHRAGAARAGASDARDLRFRWRDHPQLRAGDWFASTSSASFSGTRCDPGDDPSDFDEFEIHRARIGIEGEIFRYIQFSVEREMTEREADVQDDAEEAGVEGRLHRSQLHRRRAGAGRQVQDPVRARAEHRDLEPRLRLSVAERELSGAVAGHRRDGARPVLRSRSQLLGGRVSSGRRQCAVLEDRRRRRDGRGPRDRVAVPINRRSGEGRGRRGVHGRARSTTSRSCPTACAAAPSCPSTCSTSRCS